MSISSINTNLSALLAQSNIGNATTATSNAVSALSSGNRIVSASTDVAALAAGTGLQSQVNVLTSALSVASQGSSLLQVADGGLAQIQSILQRQQAIATSAQSGSLSSTQRGFLDQEFQQLSSEIDQLASSTSFNGVNLLDGSIAGSNPLQTATGTGNTTSNAAVVSGFTATGTITAFTSLHNGTTTSNDTTFYGDLSKGAFTVKAGAATSYDVAFSINGNTFSGNVLGTATTIDLTDAKGTKISIATTALGSSATAGSVATLQASLTTAFSGATAYAIHAIRTTDATDATTGAVISGSSIAAAATTSSTAGGTDSTNGTLLAGFTGANVTIQSAGYTGANAPSISNFTASTSGGALAGLSMTVNGQNYSTGVAAGTGGLSTETFGGGTAGIATFYLNGDTSSNEKVTLDFSGLTADSTDATTAVGVANITAALNHTFGSGGSGLSFQVGSTSAQSIGITLGSASSASLFQGATLDVKTSGDAATAADAVTVALNTVTALRATVGASEERFNFATTAIQNAVQNQGAAKSNLLDTDVAATSTQFATSQVQLQAGIAVLAQANQLQQNLLKLL